ncbi:MAG: response regulator [Velocimicrobium sp.]
MTSINIIIVDDHSMIREGLKQLLELDGDIKVIGEAGDGIECLNLLEKTQPDVLLLDINMPNINGLQVLAELKKRKMDIKILILTIHNEIEYLLKAVDMGVDGYVLKDSNSFLLKEAITAVYQGRNYIQPSLAPLLREKISNVQKSKRATNLTKRELQVVELLGEGLYNKEIAERLFISEKTVKNHVSSIFKKIGVTDRTQAVVYAIKNNIIDVL